MTNLDDARRAWAVAKLVVSEWEKYGRRDVDTHLLTLSNVTPADLDGMTGPITGTYTIERIVK